MSRPDESSAIGSIVATRRAPSLPAAGSIVSVRGISREFSQNTTRTGRGNGGAAPTLKLGAVHPNVPVARRTQKRIIFSRVR